jgi:hypothetical protein
MRSVRWADADPKLLSDGEKDVDILLAGPEVREARSQPGGAIDDGWRDVDATVMLHRPAQGVIVCISVRAPVDDVADGGDGQLRRRRPGLEGRIGGSKLEEQVRLPEVAVNGVAELGCPVDSEGEPQLQGAEGP